MVTVRERCADYFLHNVCCAIFVELLECIIVPASINEFDVYRHKPFSYEQIIIDYPPNTAITVNKWMGIFKRKMQTCNALNDVFVARSIIFCKHLFKPLHDLLWRWCNVAPHSYIFFVLAKSSCDVV